MQDEGQLNKEPVFSDALVFSKRLSAGGIKVMCLRPL
jgi:hypothetical protein